MISELLLNLHQPDADGDAKECKDMTLGIVAPIVLRQYCSKELGFTLKSQTAGVPIAWIDTFMSLPTDAKELRRVAPWFIHLPVPFDVVDEVAMLCRQVMTNTSYETFGTVKSDGTADLQKASKIKGWVIRAQHHTRLQEIVNRRQKHSKTKIEMKDVHSLDKSFHWKRAKGECNTKEGRTVVLVWSNFEEANQGHWLDITFSFDAPQKHACWNPLPKAAPLEGVTPLTGSSPKQKKRRYKAKRKQRAKQALEHARIHEQLEPGAPLLTKAAGEHCDGGCTAEPGAT